MRCSWLVTALSYSAVCVEISALCLELVTSTAALTGKQVTASLKIKIYRTIILPLVLYGCETWSLTLREERRLRGFENRVLRRIFGAKRGEVTGEWRKQHNESLMCTAHQILFG